MHVHKHTEVAMSSQTYARSFMGKSVSETSRPPSSGLGMLPKVRMTKLHCLSDKGMRLGLCGGGRASVVVGGWGGRPPQNC
jgi:hypothetical protein